MATSTWQSTFDLIGLAAYLTLMTGEVPARRMLAAAREGSGPRIVELPTTTKKPATKKRTPKRRKTAKAAA